MKRNFWTGWNRGIAWVLSLAMLTPLIGCAKVPAEPAEPVTAETAIENLREYQQSLGYDNALDELKETSTTQVGNDSYIRLQQYYEGIPVYGRTIVYGADEQGNLNSLTGNVQDVDGDIDLVPTITQEDAQDIFAEYAREILGYEVTDSVSINLLAPESLCIYIDDSLGEAVLAYSVMGCVIEEEQSGVYEIVLDAHAGNILSCYSAMYTDLVVMDLEGPGGVRTTVEIAENKDEEGKLYYTMVDDRRGIEIHSANNSTLQYELYTYNDELVMDRNYNFVRDEEPWDVYTVWISANGVTQPISYKDPPDFDPEAVLLFSNLQITYDYYEEVLGIQGFEGRSSRVKIHGFYDDAINGDTKNAYCWGLAGLQMYDLLFSFGSKNSLSLDVVAHEYAHAVERKTSYMKYSGESGAIMEALSDIYGELVENWETEKDSDWIHNGGRNLKNPTKSKLPKVYNDKYWVDTADTSPKNDYGGVHYNNTVISHSAYLMWNGIDGTQNKRLSTEELAELWYRAMLMMPSDCDFILCRELVEIAAQSMETLDDAQRACVREAFDRVGIPSTREEIFEADYHLNRDAVLTVYDRNKEVYSGYTLQINGNIDLAEIAANMTPDVGWVVNRSVTVDEAGAYELDLPQGYYALTVSDRYYDETYTFYVEIKDDHTETNIDLITEYEELQVVVITRQKQLTRVDRYDEAGDLDRCYRFSYKSNEHLDKIDFVEFYKGEVSTESTTTFTYDAEDRLLSRIKVNPEWPDESTGVKYSYDSHGNVITEYQWEGGGVEETYEYDAQGRIVRTNSVFESGSSVTEHTYDSSGRLIKDVETSRDDYSTWTDVTEYSYDAEGRLSRVVTDGEYDTSTITYDYSYLPFVIMEYSWDGGHYYYVNLADGSSDMWNLTICDDPVFYTDEDGYLAKIVDEDEYYGAYTYEFLYDDETAKPVNGPFKFGSGAVSQENTPDEENGSDEENGPDDESGWKKLYYDFMVQDRENADDSRDWDDVTYELIYVDEDEIPEMFIDYGVYAEGCCLVTVANDRLYTHPLSMGMITYVEHGGVFQHSWGHQGMFGDVIYELKDGMVSTIVEGEYDVYEDKHHWDGKLVSEKEYNQKIEQYLDGSAVKPTTWGGGDTYDYHQMLSNLR